MASQKLIHDKIKIGSFCCHENSLEYEYDDILKKAEIQEFTSIPDSSAFQQNILPREVLTFRIIWRKIGHLERSNSKK